MGRHHDPFSFTACDFKMSCSLVVLPSEVTLFAHKEASHGLVRAPRLEHDAVCGSMSARGTFFLDSLTVGHLIVIDQRPV